MAPGGISAVGVSFMTITCLTVLRSFRMGSRIGQRLASTMRTLSSAWLMMYVRSCGERRMFTVWRTMPSGGAAGHALGVVRVGIALEAVPGHSGGHRLPVEELPRALEELRERQRVVHDQTLHCFISSLRNRPVATGKRLTSSLTSRAVILSRGTRRLLTGR